MFGIVARVRAAGYKVIEPVAGEVPAAVGVPALRFVEGAVFDPDGHVISPFQYFSEGPEWERIRKERG